MKVIKRSQLVVVSLSFMVMIAGYINYKYNPEREENLGQTVFVNSKDSFMYEDIKVYEDVNLTENKDNNESNQEETTPSVDTITNTRENLYDQKKVTETISSMKSDRNNMFSELEENYTSIIEASSQNTNQAKEYQDKLSQLIKNKHLITIVEDIIKSKGIDDIVIVPTNENLNVILADNEEITKDKIAMVQKIIKDELGFPAEKVTITVP